MKTNWVAPGKGATIQELVTMFGRTGKLTHAHYMSGRQDRRTNLRITTTGEIEDYDYRRYDAAEAENET